MDLIEKILRRETVHWLEKWFQKNTPRCKNSDKKFIILDSKISRKFFQSFNLIDNCYF